MELYKEYINEHWNDAIVLKTTLLNVLEDMGSLATQIAQQEASLTQAFINEKEDSYKSTDSSARAKAKLLVGTSQTRFEYEFEILKLLAEFLTSRISQISR